MKSLFVLTVLAVAGSGAGDERDGRVVGYGLTDAEGTAVCEILRRQMAERHKGQTRCIAASGG